MARLIPVIVAMSTAAGLAWTPNVASATAQHAAPQRVIVVLRDGNDPEQTAKRHADRFGGSVGHVYRAALHGYAATLSPDGVRALAADSAVRFVVPDVEIREAAMESPSTQQLPTGIDRVDADKSSVRAGDGRGSVPVNVAVIDSGISLSHPDLNVVGGVSCSTNDSYDAVDWHGTHVAGTIGALDNNVGVVGAAPGARLWSVRVLKKNGTGTLGDILCGVDWVTATRTDADPSNDIAVANMSLGGPGTDDGNCGRTNKDALHLSICAATAAGVTVVAAAMNDGVDLAGVIPAAYDEVITVTAINDTDGQPGGLGGTDRCGFGLGPDDSAANFSNYATTTDRNHTVAAPGVCILSTTPGSYSQSVLGTSMASPHVTGTVAVCVFTGACATLSASQIVAKIVGDAVAYSTNHPGYGYAGDPSHPTTGKYYGPLIYTALY
jgi:subtilisin